MPLTKAEVAFHQKTKADCFNEAWVYLEKTRRSARDDEQLLTLAHAARYHAGVVGTARNRAIGDWQISRAYAALGEPRLAQMFAESCRRLCQANDLKDLRCTASEALARAHAVGGDIQAAQHHIADARKCLDETPLDREDREIYLGQIRDTERLIRKRGARTGT